MRRVLGLLLGSALAASSAHATVFSFLDSGTWNVRDAGGSIVAMINVHVDGGGQHQHWYLAPSYDPIDECNTDVDLTFEYIGAAMSHDYRPAAVGSTWKHALSVVSNPSLQATASVPSPEECVP